MSGRCLAVVVVGFVAAGCGGVSPSGGGGDSYQDGSVSYSDGGTMSSNDGGGGGGNIDLGGAQDFGYFRHLLDNNIVPSAGDFDAAGFFAEHYLTLPAPDCGERVCLQAMLGVMADVMAGEGMSVLQLGLNTPVTIEPGTRPPLTLAVALDVSGSMDSDDKIGYVRQGLVKLIANLDDADELAIVAYSDTAMLLAPMGSVGANRAQLNAIATSLEAGGSTNFYAGLDMAYGQVQSNFDLERQNRVILLSDGQPTSGDTSEESIMAMSAGFNSEGVALTSIGLGVSFNAQLMRGLAEQGHGNHYFLENSAAIEEVFREELDYFTVPVAFDVVLDVTAGSHYDFGSAYGSSFWVDNEDGGRIEVPSVFLAHRVAHDDTTPGLDGGVGRRGGGSALLLRLQAQYPTPDPDENNAVVAIVDISFREPGSDEAVTRHLVVNYPYNSGFLLPEGYWGDGDPAITQKSFIMLNAYLAIERACAAFHDGDGSPGIAGLMQVIAAIEDYNEELYDGAGDVDMTYDLELLRQLIEVMVANGTAMPTDVVIPDDPWPAD